MIYACRTHKHARIMEGEPLSHFTGALLEQMRLYDGLAYPEDLAKWNYMHKYRCD